MILTLGVSLETPPMRLSTFRTARQRCFFNTIRAKDPDIQQLAYTFKIDAGLTQKLNDIMIEKRHTSIMNIGF